VAAAASWTGDGMEGGGWCGMEDAGGAEGGGGARGDDGGSESGGGLEGNDGVNSVENSSK
jgi:hypothetical protein